MSGAIVLPREGELVTPALERELREAIGRYKYEVDERGRILLAKAKAKLGGVFGFVLMRHPWVQKAIEEGDPERVAGLRAEIIRRGWHRKALGYEAVDVEHKHNLIPGAGLTYAVGASCDNATAKVSAWYFAPFESDWTPGASALSNWAGAGSGPLATEFVDYDESGRQAWGRGAASAGAVTNSTPTELTVSVGISGKTLYGLTVNSVATQEYNATDKILLAATRFDNPKSGVGAGDVPNLTYTLSATSA